jgi:IS5 family transposase
MEAQKSRVRYKVEYAFYVLKNIFGFSKTRYRGLNKLDTHLRMLAVSANFYMASRSTLCEFPISVEG